VNLTFGFTDKSAKEELDLSVPGDNLLSQVETFPRILLFAPASVFPLFSPDEQSQ